MAFKARLGFSGIDDLKIYRICSSDQYPLLISTRKVSYLVPLPAH